MEPARQRSRKGCLNCRQKRKKCDEARPACARCTRAGDRCAWPHVPERHGPAASPRLPQIRPRLDPTPRLSSLHPSPSSSSKAQYSHPSADHCPTRHTLTDNSNLNNSGDHFSSIPRESPWLPSDKISAELSPVQPYTATRLLPELGLQRQFSQDTPVEIIGSSTVQRLQPITSVSAYAADDNTLHLSSIFDEDEEETFKTAQWLPVTKYVIRTGIFHVDQASLSTALDLYLIFIARCTFDPTKIPESASVMRAHISYSDCVRLGVMSAANLYQSYLKPSALSAGSRKRAKELIEAASVALQAELLRCDIPVISKLAAIGEILGYHYHSGNFGGYQKCIEQATPLVKKVVGTAPLQFHKLHGPNSVDIQLFAICDILSSLALSRPTRITYDCNVEDLLRKNKEGPNCTSTGLEWLSGIPDALLMLIVKIINLSHSHCSPAERIDQAAKIETALRGWRVWPSPITNSMMRIQRMSAQEIWRHFVILYLYQAIYKASPNNPVVQQSVKQTVQLASTLRAGHNPDCLLCPPYFLAGTFAISTQHRHFLKTRILQSNTGGYTKALANGLDEVWKYLEDVKDDCDWTTKSPPITVMF